MKPRGTCMMRSVLLGLLGLRCLCCGVGAAAADVKQACAGPVTVGVDLQCTPVQSRAQAPGA